jgi:hypothetical protein
MLRPNAPPSESESRELTKLLEDQKRAVALIEGLRKQHDAGHQRLSYKATMLKETLDSLKILNENGSKLRSDSIPLLDVSSKELLHLAAKRDFLQPLFAGTAAFFDGFSALSDAIDLLKSTLETTLGQLERFLTRVAPELYSTEMLCAQTADAITSFSSMASIAQQSIALKQNGVLHPLRRMPEELFVQIFDCCADEEAQSWLEDSRGIPQTPKVLTRIAGVCSRWRIIAHSHPRLWRRLLAPNCVRTVCSDTLRGIFFRTTVTGADLFCHALQLCQGAKLDLTIPTRHIFPTDIDMKVLELERLNLLDANEALLPIFPSPKHLWLGLPAMKEASAREIPLSLVFNTSKITSSSISPRFRSRVNTVTHLVLCGQHATLPINSLLRSLPQLITFDAKNACISNTPGVNLGQIDTHSQLRTFGVDGTGLAFLEQALVEGLRLPSLLVFEVANIDAKHLATKHPSISTLLRSQITHLGVFGTGRVAIEALRTFIDTFHRLDTLSSHAAATEPALEALYRPPSSDGDNGSSSYLLSKAVQRIVVCDYDGDGEAIYQQLQAMRADAASNGKNLEIIFEDCLNIRPDIRKKCCSSLVVQQTGRAE